MAIEIQWDFELQVTSRLLNEAILYEEVVTAVYWTCTAFSVEQQQRLYGTRRLATPKKASLFVSATDLAAMSSEDQQSQILDWLAAVDPTLQASAEAIATANLEHTLQEPSVSRRVVRDNKLVKADAPRPAARK